MSTLRVGALVGPAVGPGDGAPEGMGVEGMGVEGVAHARAMVPPSATPTAYANADATIKSIANDARARRRAAHPPILAVIRA